MKKTLCALLATATISAFAVGKGTDSKGEYWEDSAGTKHYFLFALAKSGTWYSLNNVSYSREGAQAGAKVTGDPSSWVAGSIYTLEKDTAYNFQVNEHSSCNFYGIELETLNRASAPHALFIQQTDRYIQLGEYGIHSVAGNTLQFYNNSEYDKLRLMASQTWSGPAASELSSAPFVIVPNIANGSTHKGYVTAVDDITLTIEGDTVVSWFVHPGHPLTNMDITVKSPAIIALLGGGYGSGYLNTRTLTIDGGCGIKFGPDTSFIPASGVADGTGQQTYGIGSKPLISPEKIAQTIVLTNGATLTATAETTVTGGVVVVSAGTTTNAFSGTFKLVDDDTVLRIPAGATLDLTAATFTSEHKFSVEGEGTLLLDCSVNDASGLFLLPASSLADFGGDIVVAGGTLFLDSADSIPSGKAVITEGDGQLLLIDPTGFDAATQMGGTRAVAERPRLVVTEADVTGDVVVNSGETLLVYGSGLGENASLEIWGGNVMFRRTATISAPTWYTNNVHYKTFDASVTGTVASAFSVTKGAVSTSKDSSSNLYLDADPGHLVFSGSGQWRNFTMNTGNVLVTGDYDVYGTQYFNGGHMVIRDGGHIKIKNTWQYLRLDDFNSTHRDVCLEVSTNGTFEKISGNCYTFIGTSNSAGMSKTMKLLLTGGTFIHLQDEFDFSGGGVIEVQSGKFQTARRIYCLSAATAENAKILLKGGLFVMQTSASYARSIFDGPGSCNVHIDGNATIQCSGGYAVCLDSTNEVTAAQATWTCSEGARLKVVGRGDLAGCALVLHNFEADGLIFDFNTRDFNNNTIDVRIIDPKDPLSVGFVLPGKAGSKVVASNAVPDLVASYVVPSGVTFNAAAELPTGWYENFGEVTLSNLIFEAGSSLVFPFFGGDAPLTIAGTLTLPETMSYSVAVGGERTDADAVPVIVPALGVVEAAGDSTFTCTGGVRVDAATLAVADDALAFSYKTSGIVFSIR